MLWAFPIRAEGDDFVPRPRPGGRRLFQLLVDDDTDTVVYESGNIIGHHQGSDDQSEPPLAADTLDVAAGVPVRGLYRMQVVDDHERAPPGVAVRIVQQ